jgi:hypothetical protein
VSAIADRLALTDCVNAYARGLDRLDEELLLSAFHPDAVFDNGDIVGSPTEFRDWLLVQQKGREVCQHFLTNSSFELDGDTAHGETYFIAVIKHTGSDQIGVMGGRYLDRFERRGGQWRIAARVLVRDWYFDADASRMATVLASGLHLTTRDRSDPSYDRPLRPDRR